MHNETLIGGERLEHYNKKVIRLENFSREFLPHTRVALALGVAAAVGSACFANAPMAVLIGARVLATSAFSYWAGVNVMVTRAIAEARTLQNLAYRYDRMDLHTQDHDREALCKAASRRQYFGFVPECLNGPLDEFMAKFNVVHGRPDPSA